jgi:hypothetical protein
MGDTFRTMDSDPSNLAEIGILCYPKRPEKFSGKSFLKILGCLSKLFQDKGRIYFLLHKIQGSIKPYLQYWDLNSGLTT